MVATPTHPYTDLLQQVLDTEVRAIIPLQGGCIGEVNKVSLQDGRTMVLKTAAPQAVSRASLKLEGWMLETLAQRSLLPVPTVYYKSPDALIMAFLPGESVFNPLAQTHAAELLASLHQVTAPQFGMERDTLIGGLAQPNPWTSSWVDFFAEHRLLHMAKKAYGEAKITANLLNRIEAFCSRLKTWLCEPERPGLLHGDAWTTNMLAAKGRITGFLDPAIYYGHPEIELAFTTLFGTFGEPFFKHYQEINPIQDGFFELRKDLYHLYPLLVHVRLFGGSYVNDVGRILSKVGC